MSIVKILVVDDEKELCAALCLQFSTFQKIECDYCYSAEQALSRLKETKYDVLLTDIKMPGMSGIELIQTINSTPGTEITMYAMTGYSEYTLEDVKKAGGVDLFHKPDDITKIITTVIELCEQSKATANI